MAPADAAEFLEEQSSWRNSMLEQKTWGTPCWSRDARGPAAQPRVIFSSRLTAEPQMKGEGRCRESDPARRDGLRMDCRDCFEDAAGAS